MKDDLPRGFTAATAEAVFRKAGRKDLALVFSNRPCQLAALFTTNIFCAAPVIIDKKILESGKPVRAIVANSGQANACTGEQGLANCREIQKIASSALRIAQDEVLLISTGVIGSQFDMDKWRKALPELFDDLGKADAETFTRAIMTTDAFPKFQTCEVELEAGKTRLAVMAKGAGMICPNMATMLCVVLSDLLVERSDWQKIFDATVQQTFNRVSVDGDTSTNDSILGLANGASGIALKTDADRKVFTESLFNILKDVSVLLVKDGEGASKIMRIFVSGGKTEEDAKKAARAIGDSQLVKTAIYGGDANWGRIINAIGYSGADLRPEDVSMSLCGIERFHNGAPVNDDREADLARLLAGKEIEIRVSLGEGQGNYSYVASDLGHEYVTLNSDYRS